MDRSVRRGLAVIAVALIVIAVILLAPKHKKPVVHHPPNDDPWLLVSYSPDNKYGTYLGNGFISTRIMGDGVGSQDGKPLPCFMAGLYDDEKLIPIPTWSDLRFYDGKTQFKIDKDAPYKQTLNMKTGILTTEATWRAGEKTLKGKIEVIVSRAVPRAGLVKATVIPDFSGIISPKSPFGNVDPDLEPVVWKSRTIKPYGRPADAPLRRALGVPESTMAGGDGNVVFLATALRTKHSNISFTMLKFLPWTVKHWPRAGSPIRSELRVKRDRQTVVSTYTVVVAGRADPAAQSTLVALTSLPTDDVAAHKAAWAKLWQKDIVIDGPKKDQQAIHSCMFYLLQSVREGSQWSIPPMGLSADSFSGHVFWDADTWMFPALILQHPELARAIVDYRYNTLPGAIANAKASGYAGAEYAWESGYTGKEDTPPGLTYRHERHINGDVALAQWQYYLATNDLKWLKTRGYPVIKATADYWVSRATPNYGRYEIRRVVPPDENAELVDNSVYTNAIAKMNLEIATRAAQLTGQAANPKWQEVASGMYIPFDAKAKRFIAFDGYKGWKAKQADSELLAYPLQFAFPGQDMTAIYRNTLDYYAPKVMPKGPAMSYSAHSVIAARLGLRDRAYRDFVRSYKPYLRGPLNYFNETPSEFRENYCFLTGCAGPIQSAIFGQAGIKMDYFPADPSKAELIYKPCLPKQWKSLKITGIQWHGKDFDLTVSKGNKVTIAKQ